MKKEMKDDNIKVIATGALQGLLPVSPKQ